MRDGRKVLVEWPVRVAYVHRPKASLMGRFGGGWNWKLGFTAGGRTVCLHMLVFDVRIDWWPRER